MHFAWDQRKASANLRKHAVSFDEASSVFSDESAILLDDPDLPMTRNASSCLA